MLGVVIGVVSTLGLGNRVPEGVTLIMGEIVGVPETVGVLIGVLTGVLAGLVLGLIATGTTSKIILRSGSYKIARFSVRIK